MGTAETLNSAKRFGEGGGKLDVGADDWAAKVAVDVWAEEVAYQSPEEMEGGAESDGSGTPTPTPPRWPIPVPVTPTRSSKRMAVGTPRPTRHCHPVARPM